MSRLEILLNPLYIMVLFLVTGPLLLVMGGVNYVNGHRLEKECSSVTRGVVIDVDMERELNRRQVETYYVATIKPDDSKIFGNIELTSGHTGHEYKQGQHVKIYYDPSDPSTYYIEHAEPTAGIPYMFIIGSLVLIVGLAMFGYNRIKKS